MNPRWQSARRELLCLTMAGMDVCIILPLVLVIGQYSTPFPPERTALAFFTVILISFHVARLLNSVDLSDLVRRDLAMVILLVWIVLSLRFTLYHQSLASMAWIPEFTSHIKNRTLWVRDLTIIIANLIFWWRGLELAKSHLTVNAIGYNFRLGVIILAVAVSLVSKMLDWNPIPLVLVYFLLSLVSVALARAEEVGCWKAGIPFPFNAGWLFSIVIAALIVVLAAIAFIALLTGESMKQTLALLGPIWNFLTEIILFILSIVFAVLTPLMELLMKSLLQLFTKEETVLPEVLNFENPFAQSNELLNRPSPFEAYEPILRVLAVVTGILAVSLAFGRIWQARKRLGSAQIDSVWGESEKNGGLRKLLRDGLDALTGRFGRLGRWFTAASIRRIYARMVQAAAERGYPRSLSETPYEYVTTLIKVWPGGQDHIQAITTAYVKTHYGQIPENPEELDQIRFALQSLLTPNP
ncbi:MAG: DUF4129 domain-containing protein [Anaerolineales bacterium]|nr:DUF4129 domain-containing protein [Anaerolineales bacterium]